MRLPNSYGSIVKLKGNRRKPFMVRITTSYSVDGETRKATQDRKVLGYYVSQKEAMLALAEYNKNPYTIESNSITFAEVYEKWSEVKYESASQGSKSGYVASYNAVPSLHGMKFVDIRSTHMNNALKEYGKSTAAQKKVKVLLSQLFAYAMQNDIVSKNYAEFVSVIKNDGDRKHNPFTSDEIKVLFDIVDKHEIVDTILIMIYTGFRINELLTVESENVHLKERYMIGGIKTEAGKDRIIPINKRILPLIEKRLAKGNKNLIARKDGNPYKYPNYRQDFFIPLMKSLGMEHTAHDARHTFATLMSNASADTVAIQKIIGHSSYETTANIYTHKDVDQLIKAIDRI